MRMNIFWLKNLRFQDSNPQSSKFYCSSLAFGDVPLCYCATQWLCHEVMGSKSSVCSADFSIFVVSRSLFARKEFFCTKVSWQSKLRCPLHDKVFSCLMTLGSLRCWWSGFESWYSWVWLSIRSLLLFFNSLENTWMPNRGSWSS